MFHWIFDSIQEVDQDRSPAFSSQATINWIRALRFEIEAAHGENSSLQAASCRTFYNTNIQLIPTNPPIGKIVEPLFFSILNCMSLQRMSTNFNDLPWVLPTAIVAWYYSLYFSIRSIFESNGQFVADDHSKSAKFLVCNIRQQLPYPLDMIARRNDGENYDILLNGHLNPTNYDLWSTFLRDRDICQGMLAQYLNGTANWYTDRTKKRILSTNHEFTNFRSKRAREIRDQQLLPSIGFLHCAFRQRVKANYHDSIYLTYDQDNPIDMTQFLSGLSVTSRFISIAAITYIEKRNGRQVIDNFVRDLRANLKGIDLTTPEERFWEIH
jgi:hypothetical protein